MVNKLDLRNKFTPVTVTALMLIVILFLAPGCAILGPSREGYTPKNQATFDKLVSEKLYHKAGQYLEKMALDENNKKLQITT